MRMPTARPTALTLAVLLAITASARGWQVQFDGNQECNDAGYAIADGGNG